MLGMSRMIKTWKLVSTAGQTPRRAMFYGNKADLLGSLARADGPTIPGEGGLWWKLASAYIHRVPSLYTPWDGTRRYIPQHNCTVHLMLSCVTW